MHTGAWTCALARAAAARGAVAQSQNKQFNCPRWQHITLVGTWVSDRRGLNLVLVLDMWLAQWMQLQVFWHRRRAPRESTLRNMAMEFASCPDL